MNALRAILVLAPAFLAGCVHAPLNQPITGEMSETTVQYVPRPAAPASDDLAILLFFSGGGTRASALSYGILKELARTRVPGTSPRRRMLDDVEVISAVSGGSFTAAYYCLYHDRIFRDFESRFLKRDVEGALVRRFATPTTWPKLMSPYYGRSDMAAEYYDRHLFDHATFGDLQASGGRPFLVINATDMAVGEQFAFIKSHFDLISSDLNAYPIARAVAASSAIPILLTPITLRNYSATYGGIPPDYLTEAAEHDPATTHYERQARRIFASYLKSDRPYVHLVDGGMSDNLGLQSAEDTFLLHGGLLRTLESNQMNPTRLVVIVVDASTHRGREWSKREAIPGITSAYSQITDGLGDRMDYQAMDLMRQALVRWRQDRRMSFVRQGGSNSEFYFVTVNFRKLRDPAEREFFDNLPTNLHLPSGTVDRLVDVAWSLLRQSSEYRRLLRDLGTSSPNRVPQFTGGATMANK